LFELAHDARAAGHVQPAINAYLALLKQFPSDPRVGVAALELGRLRMDSQHAYGPAADAFRRAFAAARNDGLREDALARLVEALSALRDQAACSAEQQRYLSRYPNGVHAAPVRACCSAR
jgi:TolA-binding protein